MTAGLGFWKNFLFFFLPNQKNEDSSKYVKKEHKKRKRYEERKRRHNKTEPKNKLSYKPIILLKKWCYKMDMMSRPDVA